MSCLPMTCGKFQGRYRDIKHTEYSPYSWEDDVISFKGTSLTWGMEFGHLHSELVRQSEMNCHKVYAKIYACGFVLLYFVVAIWVRPRRCDCLVTWFCYHLITKPGNKTVTLPDTENPFICHIMNLLWSFEWQGHTCSFLLRTKPLWHWRKWKSGSTSKRDPRPRYRPTGKCPLYRYETTGQLLHSEVGSNQVGCSCTWQRSLSCETNAGATKEVPAPKQSWRGCNHPTSNWPYQGHQIPHLVPWTTNWLSPLWSNTDHWPYAAGVCIVTGMSWWILHSQLVECSLWDNSWDLHSRIPARSGILLSDMM